MGLVDQRLVVGRAELLVAGPVEVRVEHRISWHIRSAVVGVDGSRIVSALNVGVQGRAPSHLAVDGLAVGVEQQLRRIAPVPAGRVVGAVYAEPVPLAGPDVW